MQVNDLYVHVHVHVPWVACAVHVPYLLCIKSRQTFMQIQWLGLFLLLLVHQDISVFLRYRCEITICDFFGCCACVFFTFKVNHENSLLLKAWVVYCAKIILISF